MQTRMSLRRKKCQENDTEDSTDRMCYAFKGNFKFDPSDNKEKFNPEEGNSDDIRGNNQDIQSFEEDEDGSDEESGEEEDDEEQNLTPEESAKKTAKQEKMPSSCLRLVHSRYPNRLSTIFFDYPIECGGLRRSESQYSKVEKTAELNVLFYTHWERNCIKNAFLDSGMQRTKKTNWSAAWMKHPKNEKYKKLIGNQKLNHFPDSWVIGRKDRLQKTISAMKRDHGSAYSFLPEAFSLPDQLDAFKRAKNRSPNFLWIQKPPASSCGRGIKILPRGSFPQLKNKKKKVLVQHYIANPYLIKGRKFDLRLYVLVTSVDPLRVYFYNDGLVRFCTEKYTLNENGLGNRFAHLTNYSVNCKSKKFISGDEIDSNKWSYKSLLEYLSNTDGKCTKHLEEKIKDILVKTIIAAENHINAAICRVGGKNKNFYELFGFDLMLDDELNPYLIEVNISPSLMGSTALDKRVKGMLMADVFHLVGFRVDQNQTEASSSCSMNSSSGRYSKQSKTFKRNLSFPRSKKINIQEKHNAKLVHLLNSNECLQKKHFGLFRDADWDSIYNLEEELERVGNFERIFPEVETFSRYDQFFTSKRYFNLLYRKYIEYVEGNSKRKQDSDALKRAFSTKNIFKRRLPMQIRKARIHNYGV